MEESWETVTLTSSLCTVQYMSILFAFFFPLESLLNNSDQLLFQIIIKFAVTTSKDCKTHSNTEVLFEIHYHSFAILGIKCTFNYSRSIIGQEILDYTILIRLLSQWHMDNQAFKPNFAQIPMLQKLKNKSMARFWFSNQQLLFKLKEVDIILKYECCMHYFTSGEPRKKMPSLPLCLPFHI